MIDPSWRGRGVGRGALTHECHQLRAEGAQRIGLEVDVENDSALAFYISVGFTPIITEDYYARANQTLVVLCPRSPSAPVET